jgi:hypothetical protein
MAQQQLGDAMTQEQIIVRKGRCTAKMDRGSSRFPKRQEHAAEEVALSRLESGEHSFDKLIPHGAQEFRSLRAQSLEGCIREASANPQSQAIAILGASQGFAQIGQGAHIVVK